MKGSAVTNDGAQKASFTAPTVAGQAAVIAEAMNTAQVASEDIDYVEAHGSGTLIGDSIEVQALERAFGGRGDCVLGTVKGNIGHLDAAAGIAGLIKTVPPSNTTSCPPPSTTTPPTPTPTSTTPPSTSHHHPTPWPPTTTPRRAGISAFGFGGTNAHLIIEEPPPTPTIPAPLTPHPSLTPTPTPRYPRHLWHP
ncbi:ketoacyl-synthetase C-terminal extension domain-containing protein [Streptomyces sp. R28]|uniref:Ketoacyl-synthetase C-terminal extension domain-containing protein n=1 Tax=Streptomyces sp. R28 TaxID=3238628 RepID=A0AB39QED4_9ACTN